MKTYKVDANINVSEQYTQEQLEAFFRAEPEFCEDIESDDLEGIAKIMFGIEHPKTVGGCGAYETYVQEVIIQTTRTKCSACEKPLIDAYVQSAYGSWHNECLPKHVKTEITTIQEDEKEVL